jgi:MinD-like ATPase involved in chromosome partitioning or flagellar assembly
MSEETPRNDEPQTSEVKKYSLAVGYHNSYDVEALRDALSGTDVKVVSYDQDAQRVFDNAVRLDVDVVLISPLCIGYRTAILQDLLFYRNKPIPVIGWTEARSDDGRQMMANGATGYITLPLDGIQVAKFVNMVHEVVDRERKRRAQGEVSLAVKEVVPDGRVQSWQSKVIAVYVPKGGGSHRTTTAVNLSVVLSHLTMGNQSTMLLDYDQSKGDCHTMLGYIMADEYKVALERNLRIIERGLYEMIVNVGVRYAVQGASTVTLPSIRNYLVDSPALPESQLDFLPGLMRPTDSGSEEFTNRQMILEIGRSIIQQVRRTYSFTVIDMGQDFSAPLHEAAIREADDVLVIVPPIMTAVLDTRYALRSLERYFGDLNKFRLITTGYDPSFGLSEKEMVHLLNLPLVATIPFDPVVAMQSVNTHTPYVLTDDGPLGTSLRALGAMYLPQLQDVFRPKTSKLSTFSIKRLFVKQA